MRKYSLFLALSLFIPAAAMSQRYGRPYTLAERSELLLQVSVQKKTHYFGGFDLRKMPRSVVTETDPATHARHVYEGVALDQLVSATAPGSQGGSVEVEFGSHQSLTISENDLDPGTKPIVADTLDGKPLTGYAPHSFVAKLRGKPPLTINDVRRITVKAS